MRKNIIVLITVVLLVGLGACGSSGDDDYAESTMEMIEKTGLNIVAMEPEPLAMARSLSITAWICFHILQEMDYM